MFEVLLEFVIEVVIQLFGEVILEWLGHLRQTRRDVAAFAAVIGYSALGALVGVISLAIFPHHFIRNEALRVVALIASPVVVGVTMAAVGKWRLGRGESLVRIDRFAYAAVFALAVSLIRWWFAR